MEDYKTEKEFCESLDIRELYRMTDSREKPFELLSKFKQHLIDTGEMVPAEKWISCEYQLPEIGQHVQACIPGGVLLYSCVLEKNNTWYGYGYSQPETRITHWKPLPPAPGEHNTKS